MALTLQPIRGCPQHSGETETRLSSAIHRRLLYRFLLREGRRLYTGYLPANRSCTMLDVCEQFVPVHTVPERFLY